MYVFICKCHHISYFRVRFSTKYTELGISGGGRLRLENTVPMLLKQKFELYLNFYLYEIICKVQIENSITAFFGKLIFFDYNIKMCRIILNNCLNRINK